MFAHAVLDVDLGALVAGESRVEPVQRAVAPQDVELVALGEVGGFVPGRGRGVDVGFAVGARQQARGAEFFEAGVEAAAVAAEVVVGRVAESEYRVPQVVQGAGGRGERVPEAGAGAGAAVGASPSPNVLVIGRASAAGSDAGSAPSMSGRVTAWPVDMSAARRRFMPHRREDPV